MEIDTILEVIGRAFSGARPEQMVRNPRHCDECAEHEEVMQAVTPQTVSLEQAGSPAWDPVCYLTDEAYCYFMPGFARLTLGRGDDYYLDQFLFHLESGRVACLNDEQCQPLVDLLDYLYETRSDEIDDYRDDQALGHVMDLLAQQRSALQAST